MTLTDRTQSAGGGTPAAQCLQPGRRYWFDLASGHRWSGTLCHSCDKLVVLTGALEMTELRAKPARAFFVDQVLAVGDLVQ